MEVLTKINNGCYKTKIPYSKYNEKGANRYYVDQNRLNKLFQHDLEDECGIYHDHPKADMLFQKASVKGHSEGFTGIYNMYVDMVDLIK